MSSVWSPWNTTALEKFTMVLFFTGWCCKWLLSNWVPASCTRASRKTIYLFHWFCSKAWFDPKRQRTKTGGDQCSNDVQFVDLLEEPEWAGVILQEVWLQQLPSSSVGSEEFVTFFSECIIIYENLGLPFDYHRQLITTEMSFKKN